MKKVIALLAPITGFTSGTVALLLANLLMEALSTGPDGVVKRHAGEILPVVTALVFSLILAFGIGILHGWTFGRTYIRRITVSTLIPACFIWFAAILLTWGVALIAWPLVMGFAWAVAYGVRTGAKLPSACTI